MKHQNDYFIGKQSIKWNIAIYIKKHFSYRVGNALLNAMC